MGTSADNYRDLILEIFNELDDESPVLKEILSPMKYYVKDLERFSSPLVLVEKFKALLEVRDENLVEAYLKKHQLEDLANMHRLQKAVNQILGQALAMLEKWMQSNSADHEIKTIIEKVRDARTLNNLNQLSDVMIRAGEDLLHQNHKIQSELGDLSSELTLCQHQIKELEKRLMTTEQAATHDHLTELNNRRSFDRDLEESVSHAHHFQESLSLLILDLDHFKQINDTFGHAVGDDVLINFARLLEKSLRDIDHLYRIGGDEFAVIFRERGLQKATKAAERVRSFVASHNYKSGSETFKLSLSGGVAQLKEGETVTDFFERADRFLYKAKELGRNQICSA